MKKLARAENLWICLLAGTMAMAIANALVSVAMTRWAVPWVTRDLRQTTRAETGRLLLDLNQRADLRHHEVLIAIETLRRQLRPYGYPTDRKK